MSPREFSPSSCDRAAAASIRAAEAADRVDLLHVPGGQVAGLLSEERNNVPAKEIVDRMVSEATQILNDLRARFVGA